MTEIVKFKKKGDSESNEIELFHWYLIAYSYSGYMGHGDGNFYHYSQNPYTQFSFESQQNFIDSAKNIAQKNMNANDTVKNVVLLGITYLGYGTKKEFIGDD